MVGSEVMLVDDLRDVGGCLKGVGKRVRYEAVYVRECTSTQDLAASLVKQGFGEGLVVVAESMSLGRGRHGRRWSANPGGLWFTLVLKPSKLSGMQLLSLSTGLSVAKSLRTLYGLNASVKWPNDVVVEGRKISGVLVEGRGDAEVFILVGVGVNVNNEIPEDLRGRAISVREVIGYPTPRTPLLIEILKNIEEAYMKILEGRSREVVDQWRQLAETLGGRVRVVTGEGIIEGRAVDVADDGALVVEETTGVRHRIYSGDVVRVS
ncbi:MAG: biotin--[acetyl-CoA-carboxylase] ligase [Zestosphaera sp.]